MWLLTSVQISTKTLLPCPRLGSAVAVKDKFLRDNFHDARKYWVLRDKKCKKCPSKLLMSICIWIKKWQVSLWLPAPLSTGSLYPKLRAQTSGIIQKLYETKTNTNTGWFKSVYWLFSEIKPKMCDFARFHCFSSKNGLNCSMTFR